MSWYEGKYSCGHEGRVNIIGPQKDRQAKADWRFSGICPECFEKKKKEEQERTRSEAEKKSKENEWPVLIGTEKQTAWANTLRVALYDKFNEKILKMDEAKLREMKLIFDGEPQTISTSKEELIDSIDYAILNHTDAAFWIDNRDNSKIFLIFFKEYLKHKDEEYVLQEVKNELAELEEKATVTPVCDTPKNGIVKIRFTNNKISAEYIKDDDFISIVKDLGYKWSGRTWEKVITEYTGSIQDRAAELGRAMLQNGFTVQFPSIEIKDMSLSGNFSFENDKWIKFLSETNQFLLVWTKKRDELYKKAKKLPGAQWEGGGIRVNLEFYREVENFAKTMGFSISTKAQCSIEQYKEKESSFETMNIDSCENDNTENES